ncbi:hypothetical protein [Halorientalis pallida]|uniref:Uncharacterized protein n=1 Tax=Halorientalis pallida TaxID=2479928 RepID=A0A498L554_9EURY|nr:hypothetical protein [Halorientalis pallida]RXK51392.1 hypothetical protein EAF64_01770 [Halorientalis pallida]
MPPRERAKAEMISRWDAVFRAVSAEQRRQVVVNLLESSPDPALSLPQAANPTYLLDDPERLPTELIRNHLPLPAEEGFVEWDREPVCVERGPRFEEVATVFEALHANTDHIPPQLPHGCHRLEEKREGGAV